MAAPRFVRRYTRRLLAAGLLAGSLAACSQAPQPVQPEEPPAEEPAKAAPAPAAEPAPAPPEAVAPSRGSDVVVIDPGDEAGEAPSLVAAAQAERERRARAGKPVAVITDKTLPQYAAKGQITVAHPKASPKGESAEAGPGPAEPAGEVRDEAYWRARALEIRQRLRRTVDEIALLEKSAAELRRRFYAEDDPYRRDSRIKPEWDRVLDRLDEAREEAAASRKELEEFLEEGRQAGALPGWLREGYDLEPAPEPPPPPPTQAIEPPELGEGPP